MATDTPGPARALLEQTRWANDFDGQELGTLAAYLRVETRTAGSAVCREGDRDGTLFILAEGRASVRKDDGSGRAQTIAALGPGHTVGEMSLIDGSPRSATVEAESDVVLLALSRDGLDRLCEERPRLGVKVLRKLAVFLSQRLRQTSGALAGRLGG